jgi:cytochrome P450
MDTEHYSARGMAPFSMLVGETWYLVPAESDPPDHLRFRLLLNPMLAPNRIAVLDDKIRHYAQERLMTLRDRGGCEFVSDFAFEFPIRVFLELMGLPQEGIHQFLAWEDAVLRNQDRESMTAAIAQITGYLAGQCEERRRNPQNDLLTLGVQAQAAGKLSEDQLTGFCFNLFVGGLDTVSTNMSSHFRHLAENPKQQAFLRAHPERIPDALDELMRVYAGVTTSRRCISETSIGEARILPGDMVMLPTILAGHDPEAYTDPQIVDFDRKPRHLSFGYGPHVCIGIHLAKRELRIAMQEALSILPEFRIRPGVQIESYLAGIVGPRALPLVWNS